MKSDGLGDMLQRLEELKRRLADEGLFEASRKVPLPRYPRCVGLVTGGNSAAVEDMKRILLERWPCHIKVYPALVQGEQAPAEIVRGIRLLDQDPEVEVIIVGRGGGAFEELLAFSDERVVRAVAACETPIVSAVGHEVDTPLCDHAADHRAPTPTAAAQTVVPDGEEVGQGLKGSMEMMSILLERYLSRLDEGLDNVGRTLDSAVDRHMESAQRRLATLEAALAAVHPARRLEVNVAKVSTLAPRLDAAMGNVLSMQKARLARLGDLLDSLGPKSAMERGYCLLRDAKGAPVLRAGQASVADKLAVVMADGELGVTVESVEVLG